MAKTDAIRVPIEVEWRNDEAYRRGYEAGREAQAIPLIDVDRLARALRSVDFRHNKELIWAAAENIADAIAAEYARLASESSTPPCGDAAGHYAMLCDCFSAALPVKEGEPKP